MDKEEIRIKLVKKLPIILIVLIILIVTIFLIIHNNSNGYIIFGDYLIYETNGKHYKQIDEIDDKILKNKFTVNDGKTIIKDVELKFTNNHFYLYDKNDVYINIPSFKVATYKTEISLADYEKKIINNAAEDNFIQEFLNNKKQKSASLYKGFTISYDFDKDGSEEKIYTINNYSLSKQNYEQNGYMFIVKNGNIVYETSKSDSAPYTVMEIADLNNDKNYEVIVNKGSRDLKTFNSCYQIYELKKGKWQLTKDCE